MPRKLATSTPQQRCFIREWRDLRGMTQAALAEQIEMDGSNLSRLERGEIAYTQQTLEAAATALRVAVADLLRDPNSPAAPIYDLMPRLSQGDLARVIGYIEGVAAEPDREEKKPKPARIAPAATTPSKVTAKKRQTLPASGARSHAHMRRKPEEPR